MTEIVKKKQIFQIAKELNISHDDIISFLESKKVIVTSRMMKVDPEIYELILNEFARERQQIDRFRKDQARMVVVDTRREDKAATDINQLPSIETKTKDTISLSLKDRIQAEKNRISDSKKKAEEERIQLEQEELLKLKSEQEKVEKEIETSKQEEHPKSKLKIVRYATKEEKDKLEG